MLGFPLIAVVTESARYGCTGSSDDREAEREGRSSNTSGARPSTSQPAPTEVVGKRRAQAEQDRPKARVRRTQETPEERARQLAPMRMCQTRQHSLETPGQHS